MKLSQGRPLLIWNAWIAWRCTCVIFKLFFSHHICLQFLQFSDCLLSFCSFLTVLELSLLGVSTICRAVFNIWTLHKMLCRPNCFNTVETILYSFIYGWLLDLSELIHIECLSAVEICSHPNEWTEAYLVALLLKFQC